MSMSRERAERIVSAILKNLKGRRGIRDALDSIGYDVWEEMVNDLADEVLRAERNPE